ncbi:MAG: dihydrofolate synthase/folylpolyglutamate synthase [Cellvibrionaceae bacterium]|jgi:dihydrofolate synthase/folylpolyglutamate synthase
MNRFDNLSSWLNWLEQLHPKSIDLGLERVYTVATQLKLLKCSSSISHSFSGQLNTTDQCSVITVAGTNGKGSCVATLEKALLAQPLNKKSKHRVGSYTSPHLHHYCERIRIDGKPVSAALVCDAFSVIDQARKDISLTYFEFGTLAALWVFTQEQIPFVLLEVGLGGRLDAVNIVDADIAVVTSIDIDHQDWLGSDRDIISQEKLGVSREFSPLIITESRLTPSLKAVIERKECLFVGRDFSFVVLNKKQWRLQMQSVDYLLPLPLLPLASVVAAIVVLAQLDRLPDKKILERVVLAVSLPGRFEMSNINGIDIIYDVAHNPAAAEALAKRLANSAEGYSKSYAVMGVMADKDHLGIIKPLLSQFHSWFLGGLPDIPRAASEAFLLTTLSKIKGDKVDIFAESTVEKAFDSALAGATSHDRIVIFGSFYTVAAVQNHLA